MKPTLPKTQQQLVDLLRSGVKVRYFPRLVSTTYFFVRADTGETVTRAERALIKKKIAKIDAGEIRRHGILALL